MQVSLQITAAELIAKIEKEKNVAGV